MKRATFFCMLLGLVAFGCVANAQPATRATLYLVASPGQTTSMGVYPSIGACRSAMKEALNDENRRVLPLANDQQPPHSWIAFMCVPLT